MKPKVGEWWVCEHISIMGNGDSISAYKMTPGLIIAGNVKPIERLYSEQERDRMVEEIAELREALGFIVYADEMIKEGLNVHGGMSMMIGSIESAKELLAKLNQEGEE